MKLFFVLLATFVMCELLTFAYGYFLGMTGARKKFAEELVSLYTYAGAEGSKARVEFRDAVKLIAEEFDAFKAKTSAVWKWVHLTIAKL